MGSDGRVKLNIDNDIDNRMYCLQTIGTSLPFSRNNQTITTREFKLKIKC